MNRLFHSATVRLTAWYVTILAIICLMFSVILYQITISEVRHRLSNYTSQTYELQPRSLLEKQLNEIRATELTHARANLIVILFYTNLAIIMAGGVGAYFLAKRTLQPIEDMHNQQIKFVSDASHELRTPLATMTTELEVALRDKGLKKDEMKDLLNSNLEEVRRLTDLSNMLLALSAGNSTSLEQTPFDLVATTNSVIDRVTGARGRIAIETPLPSLLTIGHQPSIEELITILIDNAIKYSPPESIITISILRKHRAYFHITNLGDGISEEHLPRIFDRFYRADSSRSGSNGYGLGLALAKQISDVHQAELSVKSTRQHTEFFFSLPLKK